MHSRIMRSSVSAPVWPTERDMRALAATLRHIDATIPAFDPNAYLEDITPKLPGASGVQRGEVSRILLP
jgi:hypothetical protein